MPATERHNVVTVSSSNKCNSEPSNENERTVKTMAKERRAEMTWLSRNFFLFC